MRLSAASDGDLLQRVRSKDVAALETLYDDYAPYVLGIAIQILRSRDDAEEVVQDVFWKIWHRNLQYDPLRGRFSTWLFAIARNEALDHLRRRRVRAARAEDPPPIAEAAGTEDPEQLTYLADRRRALTHALAALTAPERDVLRLAFFQGCSHSEVAERTGEPLGTVKSRIRRAVDKLRESLQDGGALS